jgi:hypothetical protein
VGSGTVYSTVQGLALIACIGQCCGFNKKKESYGFAGFELKQKKIKMDSDLNDGSL